MFVLPIDHRDGKVVLSNWHRASREKFPDVLRIVLAVDGQKDAPALKGKERMLEILEGLAARQAGTDLDSLGALAEHPAPERVVEVENEALSGAGKAGMREPVDLVGQMGQKPGVPWHPREIMGRCAEAPQLARPAHDAIQVEHMRAEVRPEGVDQGEVEPSVELDLAELGLEIGDARDRKARPREIGDHDRGIGRRLGGIGPASKMLYDTLQLGVLLGRAQRIERLVHVRRQIPQR
jgi:hypothetical protein